jgi:thiamine kinase-like enzyme
VVWFLQKQSTDFISSNKQLAVPFKQLQALSFFKTITAIEEVSTGLSSQCFKVIADGKAFFVKKITTPNEVFASLFASEKGIGANVVYHDKNWLINPFIDGENLALSQQPIEQKIAISMKLMQKIHKVNAKPAILMPAQIINEHICQPHFSTRQQADLTQLAKQLIKPLTQDENTAYCHGDLNFSNVLITAKSEAFLVDFECACSAPIEFDLAMFIAVNNIKHHEITMVLQCYQQKSSAPINRQLLNAYVLFCYLINGLWYVNRYHIGHQPTFKLLAQQQWEKLNKLLKNKYKQLFCCLGIKL